MALIMLIIRLDQAHSESQTKSKNIRAVKQAARELGGWLGGQAPYGFKAVKVLRGKIAIQLLEHEPEEAENIRRIWSEIKKHMHLAFKSGSPHPGSLSGLCTYMNDNGIPTRGQRTGKARKNTKWDSRTLKRIMMDPRLAGFGAYPVYKLREDGTPTKTVLEYRMLRDSETMEPISICEPIIPPAEWFQLQEWLQERGRGRGLSRGKTLLSSLYSECGAVLTCECARPMTGLGSIEAEAEKKRLNEEIDRMAIAADAKKSQKASTTKPVYRCTRPRGGANPGEHEAGNAVMQTHLDHHVARRIFDLVRTAEGDLETL